MPVQHVISPEPHKDALSWKRTKFNVQTKNRKLIFATKDLKRTHEDGSKAMTQPTRPGLQPQEKKYIKKGTVLCVKVADARRAVGTGKWKYVYPLDFQQSVSRKPSQVFATPIEKNTRDEETDLAKEARIASKLAKEELAKEEKKPRK